MTDAHTPGPWRSIVDDTGGQWSGWPLCIVPENDDDKSVVRTGGQWPYEWDAATSQREAVANARLIAAAPDLLEALLTALPYVEDHEESNVYKRGAVARAVAQIRAAIEQATN